MSIEETILQVKKLYPSWQAQNEIYRDEVSKCITNETKLLDIGCG